MAGRPRRLGQACPAAIPLIGRLQDSQYTLDGRAWSISTHGFARDAQFQVSEQGPTAPPSSWRTARETRRVYPFSFVLTVTYTLEGSRLTKAHRVENRSAVPMLYELGGHDGFRTPWARRDYGGLRRYHPYGMDSRCMLTIGSEARLSPGPAARAHPLSLHRGRRGGDHRRFRRRQGDHRSRPP